MRAKKTKTPVQVVLGIDMGSTAMRAVLLEGPKNVHVVECKERPTKPGLERGDFSVACCPLNPDPVQYLGLKALDRPDNRKDDKFLERSEDILKQLHSTVRDEVKAVCAKTNNKVAGMAVSIPLNWTEPFQSVYRRIISGVYKKELGIEMDQVYFISEIDALMHYSMQKKIWRQEEADADGGRFQLILDFGGHSMHWSLFRIDTLDDTSDDTGRASFVEIESGSVAGGSELWSHHAYPLIKEKLAETKGSDHAFVKDPTGEVLMGLRQNFDEQKVVFLPDLLEDKAKPIRLNYYRAETDVSVSIPLTVAEIERCFQLGFAGPLEAAKKAIAHLKALNTLATPDKLGVIVAGGSLNTRKVIRRLLSGKFPDLEEKLVFTSEARNNYLSSAVAEGAALAVKTRISVSEFFKRGARLLVQELQEALTNDVWDSGAQPIGMDKDSPTIATFETKMAGGSHFRLVCDPVFGQRGDHDLNTNINNTYDLKLVLGKLPAGHLRFSGQVYGSGYVSKNLPYLALTLTRKHRSAARATTNTLRVPLYFDPGHNCVHVDWDAFEDREAVEAGTWFTGKLPPSLAPKKVVTRNDTKRVAASTVTSTRVLRSRVPRLGKEKGGGQAQKRTSSDDNASPRGDASKRQRAK
ncbi:hypothetical protein QBC39DRAFT_416983 [Podospora conica]|nr:hypothetical protein QBC39DRAFT_416983 [Schizothecium conicum]